MRKRGWSLILALALAMSLLPGTVLAAGGKTVSYEVTGGSLFFEPTTGTVVHCDETVTEAVIPETIGGKTVTTIGRGAFHACAALTSVTLPATVTVIGDSAFDECGQLTRCNLPAGLKTLGKNAFQKCESLTGTMTLPAGLTAIGGHAFEGCRKLTGDLIIPAGVTKIEDSTFWGCEGLNGSLSIPAGVTEIGSLAFYDCFNLTGPLTLPSGLKQIGRYAFADCRNLKGTLSIPAGVTEIGDAAFADCSSLTGPLTLPAGLKILSRSAFQRLHDVTGSLTIPFGVTTIRQYAFMDCTGLTEITIPESVKTIEDYAFAGCSKVTAVVFTGTREQWQAVTVGEGNEIFSKIDIRFEPANRTAEDAPSMMSFRDVSPDAWYAADAEDVLKYGIIQGTGGGNFSPNMTLSLAQAVTMAARTHAALNDVDLLGGGDPWYRPYVEYALKNGICAENEFAGSMSDWNNPCSRLNMAILFQRVFPGDTAKELNTVSALPDVTDSGAGTAVFYLYRQGVLTGGDARGTFYPDRTITRAEVAAILNRIMDPGKRKTFQLTAALPAESGWTVAAAAAGM